VPTGKINTGIAWKKLGLNVRDKKHNIVILFDEKFYLTWITNLQYKFILVKK
jgi:hypothetical protein